MDIKNDKELIAKAIWESIKDFVEATNDQGIEAKDVTMDLEAIKIYPTITFEDEQANRYGALFYNLRKLLSEHFETPLYFEGKPRTEFQMYPKIEDVFLHFYEKLAGERKPVTEIPFE
jgi:hypothetical protein